MISESEVFLRGVAKVCRARPLINDNFDHIIEVYLIKFQGLLKSYLDACKIILLNKYPRGFFNTYLKRSKITCRS